MSYKLIFSLLLIIFPLYIQASSNSNNQELYNQAYAEIASMLETKDTLNFKRATFLIEWAYTKGELNYNQFCSEIDAITANLRLFIKQKGVQQFRTAGNFALFEYFTKPNWMNNNQPFTYDFEDFTGSSDFRQIFVTKLMATHKGQCRSLPMMYKILAEELNTEAFLALAPNHMYVKHLDENNRWVNIELTNGHFSTDAWMISTMDISAEAIRNRIYLDPITLKESIALCLTDLSMAYQKQYGYDDFVLKCCNKSLEYFPHCMPTLFHKFNTLQDLGKNYIAKNGQIQSTYIEEVYAEYKKTQKIIESLGYQELSKKNYEDWLKAVENEKEKEL